MAWEILIYFLPLIFFAVQLIIMKIADKEIDATFIFGSLIAPFVTAFYFLNLSIGLFVFFIIVTFIFVLFSLVSYAMEKDKLGFFFVVLSLLTLVAEYLFLLEIVPLV